MSAGTLSAIPGLHQAAVNAIQDENTRIAIQSLIDGISQSNLRLKAYTDDGLRKITSSPNGVSASDKIKPGDIARIINDLNAQIAETRLFKDLGERVALIDRPDGIFDRLEEAEVVLKSEIDQRVEEGVAVSKKIDAIGVRVGDSEAALKNETTQRANADNALAEQVSTQYSAVNKSLALIQEKQTTLSNSVASISKSTTQIQASVDENAVAIREETEARVSSEGVIYGQYFIKIDANGRVSGFGLANDGVTSDFIVRADRFAIASPTGKDSNGNPIQPSMPFMVVTTPMQIGGQTVVPGVYMNAAFISDGSITKAKIGLAEIDTLRIAGNAITQPVSVQQDGYQSVSTNTPSVWTPVAVPLVVDMGSSFVGVMSVLICITFKPKNTSGGGWYTNYKVVNETTGTTVLSGATSTGNNLAGAPATTFALVSVGTGVQQFRLYVQNLGEINGDSGVQETRLFALGAKR